MKRWANRIAITSLLAITTGCGQNGPSRDENREFEKLEHALGTLSNAPPEDRDIRLGEVAKTKIQTERVKKVKDLCIESYQLFGKATQMLEAARQQTKKTESKLARAKALKESAGEIPVEDEKELKNMSQSAAQSLTEVTQTLDRAEKAVTACQEARQHLRTYISAPQ